MSSKYLRNLFHIFSLFPNGVDVENQLFDILAIMHEEDITDELENEINEMINKLEENNCIEQIDEGVFTLLEHNWTAFIMLYNMNENNNSNEKQEKQKYVEKKPIKKDRIVDVKSFTDKGQSYQVNLDQETCSCPDFKYRGTHICKHIETIANNPSKYGLTDKEVEEFCENIEAEKPAKNVKAAVKPVKENWQPKVKEAIKKALKEEKEESDDEESEEDEEESEEESEEEYQPQMKRRMIGSRSSTRATKAPERLQQPVQKKFTNYQDSQIHPIQKTVQQLVNQVVQQAQQTHQQVQNQMQQVQQQVQDFVKPFVQQQTEQKNEKEEVVDSPAQQLFQQNTIVQPVQPIINNPSDNIIDIPSFKDPNMKYQVNTTQGHCSCPDFKYRGPIICKHIDEIVNNPAKYNLTPNDATDLEKKFSRKQN